MRLFVALISTMMRLCDNSASSLSCVAAVVADRSVRYWNRTETSDVM